MHLSNRLTLCAALLAAAAGSTAQAHVLWGNEHEARAKALATAYGEKSSAVPADRKAIVSADKTLTIWGHGGQTSFSEMTDAQAFELIKNWKAKNSGLETVEFVTCDARHAQNRDLDAFAARVKALMAADSVTRGVKLKGLPIGQHPDDVSILWANGGSATFLYITAPDQKTFDAANAIVKADTTGDLATLGNNMAKDSKRKYTVNYGAIKILRASLGEVR
jgi:hypothetical protein